MAGPTIRTLAGAVDFDGAAIGDPGRVDFPAVDLPPALRFRIASISYFGAPVTDGFTLTLAPRAPVDVTTRQRFRNVPGLDQSFYVGCQLIVPTDFLLEVVSTGKTGSGTLIVDWFPDVAVNRGARG